MKEVKRIAKVGEYIKVISEPFSESYGYSKGDIYKVLEDGCFYGEGSVIVGDEYDIAFIDLEEYVVLENYAPPKDTMMDALYGKSELKTLSDYTIKELLGEVARRIK